MAQKLHYLLINTELISFEDYLILKNFLKHNNSIIRLLTIDFGFIVICINPEFVLDNILLFSGIVIKPFELSEI